MKRSRENLINLCRLSTEVNPTGLFDKFVHSFECVYKTSLRLMNERDERNGILEMSCEVYKSKLEIFR